MLEWFELKWILCVCWKTVIIKPGAQAGKNWPEVCRHAGKKKTEPLSTNPGCSPTPFYEPEDVCGRCCYIWWSCMMAAQLRQKCTNGNYPFLGQISPSHRLDATTAMCQKMHVVTFSSVTEEKNRYWCSTIKDRATCIICCSWSN